MSSSNKSDWWVHEWDMLSDVEQSILVTVAWKLGPELEDPACDVPSCVMVNKVCSVMSQETDGERALLRSETRAGLDNLIAGGLLEPNENSWVFGMDHEYAGVHLTHRGLVVATSRGHSSRVSKMPVLTIVIPNRSLGVLNLHNAHISGFGDESGKKNRKGIIVALLLLKALGFLSEKPMPLKKIEAAFVLLAKAGWRRGGGPGSELLVKRPSLQRAIKVLIGLEMQIEMSRNKQELSWMGEDSVKLPTDESGKALKEDMFEPLVSKLRMLSEFEQEVPAQVLRRETGEGVEDPVTGERDDPVISAMKNEEPPLR